MPDVSVVLALLAVAVVTVVALAAGLGRLRTRLGRAEVDAAQSRAALDHLEDAVLVIDTATHEILHANLAADLLGGGRRVVGMRPSEAGPWPNRAAIELMLAADAEERSPFVVDEGHRVVEVTASAIEWDGVGATLLVARDTTRRREAERAVGDRERRFRALAEDVAGVVYRIRVQPELEVEYVSPRLQEVLGYQPAEFYVEPTLLQRSARPEHRAALDLLGERHVYGRAGRHAYSVRHADGRWLWVEDHHTPEHDEDGRLVAVQGILFDVSAKWETEQALGEALRKHEVATETLHRTARVERTLIQSISHELRTPMTSALGFARMLQLRRAAIPVEQQDALLERLVANIERIEELVAQFLEWDRYSRDDAEIERSLQRLDEVVAQTAAQVDMEGRTLHQHLELVMVMIDRRRVEQVVEHLLENIVHHTPPETVAELTVTADDEVARITVTDNGPGVADEIAGHAFSPFTQGPASTDDANPGVGLGLAMVQVTARLHGGEARLERMSPHGARFVVELPLAGAEVAATGGDHSGRSVDASGDGPRVALP